MLSIDISAKAIIIAIGACNAISIGLTPTNSHENHRFITVTPEFLVIFKIMKFKHELGGLDL